MQIIQGYSKRTCAESAGPIESRFTFTNKLITDWFNQTIGILVTEWSHSIHVTWIRTVFKFSL